MPNMEHSFPALVDKCKGKDWLRNETEIQTSALSFKRSRANRGYYSLRGIMERNNKEPIENVKY
jgi:hypothetical protein